MLRGGRGRGWARCAGWGWGCGRSSFIKSLREVAPVVFQPVHQWGRTGARVPAEGGGGGSLSLPPPPPHVSGLLLL